MLELMYGFGRLVGCAPDQKWGRCWHFIDFQFYRNVVTVALDASKIVIVVRRHQGF